MLSIIPEPTLCEQLGYFALVCKLRIYVSLGDYYQAIRILDMIPNKALDVFRKNAACYTALFYYGGFALMMSGRIADAIDTFTIISTSILRTNSYNVI